MGRSIYYGRRKWDYETGSYEKRPRERAIFPLEMAEYAAPSQWPFRYKSGMCEDRTFAPYQPGDIIYAYNQGIRIGRVRRVTAESMKDKDGEHDYYIPKYAVQWLTKDRHWSNNYEYVFPGFIYSAYYIRHEEKDKRDTLRGLPPFMLEEWIPALWDKLTEREKQLAKR